MPTSNLINDENFLDAVISIKQQLIKSTAEKIVMAKLSEEHKTCMVVHFAELFNIEETAFQALVNRSEKNMINQN